MVCDGLCIPMHKLGRVCRLTGCRAENIGLPMILKWITEWLCHQSPTSKVSLFLMLGKSHEKKNILMTHPCFDLFHNSIILKWACLKNNIAHSIRWVIITIPILCISIHKSWYFDVSYQFCIYNR